MQITNKITLNLSGEEVFAPIMAHQGDLRSRVVECTLQKDGVPYTIEEGTIARATYKSAAGVSDIHDVEIAGNVVIVPLVPSLLASPGDARCDVILSKGGAVVGTGRFTVLVSPAAAIGHDLEKSPEYQSFVAALADADQWKADTVEAISKATEATEGANTAARAANAAAASVDAAKQAALEAAQSATAAAGSANTAAGGADTAKAQAEEAAQSAQTAATRANEAADGIESTGIIAHMQNTSNPHQVTAEQVGAVSEDAVGDVSLTATAQFKGAKIRVARAGKIVTFCTAPITNYTKPSEGGYPTMCTLPQGYRPSSLVDVLLPLSGGGSVNVMVDTDGKVSAGVISDAASMTLRIVFTFAQ